MTKHECAFCGYNFDCGNKECGMDYSVEANCENHGGSKPRAWDSL